MKQIQGKMEKLTPKQLKLKEKMLNRLILKSRLNKAGIYKKKSIRAKGKAQKLARRANRSAS